MIPSTEPVGPLAERLILKLLSAGGMNLSLIRPSPSCWSASNTLRFLLTLGLALTLPLVVQSQEDPARQITGVVTDSTGAAIAGAEVIFSGGSVSTTTVTDNHGAFAFSAVTPESG